MNKYKIKWAILEPKKGIARKTDVQKCCGIALFNRSTRILIHAPDNQVLIRKLESLKGKLSKAYNVVIITDAQMALVKDNNYTAVATTKQLNEMFYLN